MADTKISALTASTTPLAGTEVLPIVQSGVTKQVSVANLTAGRAISATQLTLTTGNVIVANGQGIDFSATPGTGTSELLADYEEGTWTPADASGAALTFANVSASYTKVGRQVFAHYYFTYPATADVSANALTGLPFTASNVNAARGGSAVTYNEMNALISIFGPRNGIGWQYVNGVGNAYTNAQMSGKTFMGCITYFV